MSFLKNSVFAFFLLFVNLSYAQFLPNNTALSVQSVQRWMESNRDFAGVIQVLDEMHKTEEESKKFDVLPAVEQDQKITAFLIQKNQLETANAIAARHGWKSIGEYIRLSTKLGNAIAAYFFIEESSHLSDAQRKALRTKTDPAVLNAPPEDIAFVKANENLLKNYIQAYSKGRK